MRRVNSFGPYFTVSSKRLTKCLLLLPSPFWNTTIAYPCWTTQVVVADAHAVSPSAAPAGITAPANALKYCRVIACPRSWLGAASLDQAERLSLYPMSGRQLPHRHPVPLPVRGPQYAPCRLRGEHVAQTLQVFPKG